MKKTNFYTMQPTNCHHKAFGFLFFLLSLLSAGSAHAQDYAWAKSMGGSLGKNGQSITVDASGNVYTTGYFEGTVDFDPSAATFNLTSVGSYDIFVTKFDASGNFVWAKSMGSVTYDIGQDIAVDASGNVYITGQFNDTVDFDPSAATANLTSAGNYDIFVCKLNASGNYVWAVNMGGTGYDAGYSIAVDGSGNVYTTGIFEGTADFNPSSATANNLTSAGSNDGFVSKLSSTGAYSWAIKMGSTSIDGGQGIALDGSGNVYVTGYFAGTVDFDPSAATVNLTAAGSTDIFVCKFSSAGAYSWAKSMGGTGDDYGRGIAIDASGNVYTTGSFEGTADFDPSATTANLTSAGGTDIFVSKLSSTGAYSWANKMGSTSYDFGNNIALDGSGNVYTTGGFEGTVDFDPSAATANLTSAGSRDIFISKFSTSGAYSWAKSMGSTNFDSGYGIAVDASNNVYTTGQFSLTVDFDPSAATANLVSAGYNDIFVSKLGLAPAAYSVTGTSACSSVTVGLSGSESGVTYQLKRDGTNVGTATSGTGSALSFGSQTTAGTYTVVATRTNSGISLTMTGSPIVYVTPTITTSASAAICAGATSFTIPYTATTGTPTTYSISGTGITTVTNGALPATPITVNLSAGASGSSISYTLTVKNASACTSSNVTGSVTVNALPTITKSASTAICAGATSFTIPYTATTGTPTTYSISGTGITTVTDGALPATPITVNLSSPASGSSISYTLTVKNANSCTSSNVTGSVTVNALPTTYTVTGTSACNSVTVGLSGSQTGVTYQLKRDGTNVGTAVTGTGAALAFGSQTTAGTYTVVATTTASGCTATMTNSPSVYATPTITKSASTAICAGATSFTIPYTATTGTPTTYSISGTGITTVTDGALPATPITVNLSSPASGSSISYTLTVKNANSCTSSNVTGSVTVNALPTAYTVTGTSACNSVTVGLSGSQTGVTYQLKRDGTNVGTAVTGTGAALNFGSQTTAGTYTVVATTTASGCTATMTGNPSVYATPTITTSASTAICGGATSFTIPYTATTGTPTTYSISGTGITTVTDGALPATPITVNLSSGASGSSISYTLTVRNANGCTSSNVTGSVTVNAGATAYTVTGGGTYNAGGAGLPVGLSNSQTGVTYQLKNNGIDIGATLSGTGAALSFGNQTIAGTYTVVATHTTSGCTATMSGSAVISVSCPSSTTLHVNASVSGGTGDGSSWANAYASLSDALAAAHACSNITLIKVAAGTYKPTKKPFDNGVELTLDNVGNPLTARDNTFHLRYGLTLEGGYDAAGNRNITANVTTLSGDFNGDDVVTGSGATLSFSGNSENAYHVVLALNPVGAGITIDGFTVKGGNADGTSAIALNMDNLYRNVGSGIFTFNGINTFNNNILTGNYATIYGGGIYNFNASSSTVTNNTFLSNKAGYGGGIYTKNATVSNNTFSGNYAAIYGGGILLENGANTLNNNILTGNYATGLGGGVYSSSVDFPTTLTNNVLHGNSANYGGGMSFLAITGNITNNTFYSNTASGNGGGLFIVPILSGFDFGTNTLTNNVFWDNKKGTANNVVGADYFNQSDYNFDVEYNVYATNTFKNNILQLASSNYTMTNTGDYAIGTGASGNRFAQDPYFTEGSNPAGADGIFRTSDDGLRLACNSSARDAGTNTGAPSTDILGNTIYNTTKDMGAYESQTDCLNTIYTGSSNCEETTLSNVSGNTWFTIYGKTGIIGSINPNGLNLGTLTINIGDPSSVITKSNTKYMGRSINIRSSNYADGATMPSNYTLRLYYKDSELTELNTANGQTTTATQLYMGWQSGGGTTCDWDNYAAVNSGTIINTGITYQDYGIGNNGFSLQFDLNHFTAFAPYAPATVLPVELLNFTGKNTEGGNLLTWQTASEVNNKGFEVERLNGNDWQNIGFVKGNNKASDYQFIDKSPLSTSYYRLKQLDNDGKFEYSKVISIAQTSKGKGLSIYPNPVSNILNLNYTEASDFQIFNLLGQQVLTGKTAQRLDVSALSQGTYILKVGAEQVKFVKQ